MNDDEGERLVKMMEPETGHFNLALQYLEYVVEDEEELRGLKLDVQNALREVVKQLVQGGARTRSGFEKRQYEHGYRQMGGRVVSGRPKPGPGREPPPGATVNGSTKCVRN